MLETILEKSKNLIKRAKKPFIGTLAGLTLLSAIGCKSLGKEWKTIDVDYRTIEKGEFEFHKVKYKLSEPDLLNDNILSIFISESRDIETYKEKEIITEEKQEEYKNKEINYKGVGFGIGYGTGLIAGIIVGDLGIVLVGGFLLGAIGTGIAGEPKITSTSTGNQRTIITDNSTEKELINTETKPESPAETYVLITSKDIKFKKLDELEKLPKKEITVYTKDGEAKVKVIEDILEFEFKKQELIAQIKEWAQIKQIKEPTRSKLLPLILDYITNQNYQINIETMEENSSFKQVINDKTTISVFGYIMPSEKIYVVLEDFINQEINSKIKEARIRLIDASTHTAIQDATLDIETEAPSKTDLAKKYFEDDLLNWSIKKIRDYLTGQEIIKYDSNGEAVFSVYTPNAYKTESIHKKYAFAKFNFDFSDPKKLKQTVEMSQDPQKIKLVDK